MATLPRLPGSLDMDAGLWAQAPQQATSESPSGERHLTARLATQLKALDPATVMQILQSLQFDSDDQQIALGWIRVKRKGLIAQATGWHGELVRLLVAVFRARHTNVPCSTIAVRRGAAPLHTKLGCTPRATLRVMGPPGNPTFQWDGSCVRPAPLFAVGFYQTDAVGGVDQYRNAGRLSRLGLCWGRD